MFLLHIQYKELQKKLLDYKDLNCNLQLKNKSLSDGINHLKREQEITIERYKRSEGSKGIEEYVKNVLDNVVEYPRYTAIDILQLLPEEYILGKSHEWWYCKDSTDSWADVVYYEAAEEACANAYEKLLKESKAIEKSIQERQRYIRKVKNDRR